MYLCPSVFTDRVIEEFNHRVYGKQTVNVRLKFAFCKNPSPGVRPDSHGTGRIFDRLKNLTGHFVRTEPCNVCALFTRN